MAHLVDTSRDGDRIDKLNEVGKQESTVPEG